MAEERLGRDVLERLNKRISMWKGERGSASFDIEDIRALLRDHERRAVLIMAWADADLPTDQYAAGLELTAEARLIREEEGR